MLIYGKNPIKDLFEHDSSLIKKVYIEKKRHQAFFSELEKAGIAIEDYSAFKYNEEINSKDNTQKIIAEIEDPKLFSIRELIEESKKVERPVFLILDRIEDPQNFGAIIRNAAAFNVSGIIYPSRNSARLNSTSMKTSAGNWLHVNLCEITNLSNAVRELKQNDFWIASTSLEGDKTLDELRDFDRPLAILLGNEGKGVKKSLQDEADFNVKINISEKVESLNVSSASAIILHSLIK